MIFCVCWPLCISQNERLLTDDEKTCKRRFVTSNYSNSCTCMYWHWLSILLWEHIGPKFPNWSNLGNWNWEVQRQSCVMALSEIQIIFSQLPCVFHRNQKVCNLGGEFAFIFFPLLNATLNICGNGSLAEMWHFWQR